MKEYLDFMFSSFWMWLGCMLLIAILLSAIVAIANITLNFILHLIRGYPTSKYIDDDENSDNAN